MNLYIPFHPNGWLLRDPYGVRTVPKIEGSKWPPNNDPNRGLASTAHVKLKEVVFSCDKIIQWKFDHGSAGSSSLKTFRWWKWQSIDAIKKSQAKSGAALGSWAFMLQNVCRKFTWFHFQVILGDMSPHKNTSVDQAIHYSLSISVHLLCFAFSIF